MQENAADTGKARTYKTWSKKKIIKIAVLIALLLVGAATIFTWVNRAQKSATEKKVKTALNSGSDYYKEGKFDKAISSLEQTIKLDPENAKAHLLLAQSYQAEGELDKTVDEYREYLKLEPDHPEVRYNLAIIYKSQNKTKRAIAELEETLKLRKDFAPALLVLAELYAQQGEKQKAIDKYEQVIKIKPFGVDLAEVQKKLDSLK